MAKNLLDGSFDIFLNVLKIEWISEGRSENRSTALTKRLCESQNRVWISKTVRDMTMILFSSYRSSRGGSKVQTISSFDV